MKINIILNPTTYLFPHKFGCKISGPCGFLIMKLYNCAKIEQKNNILTLSTVEKNKRSKINFGLFVALLKNAIKGVENKFSKTLKIAGSGYKFILSGKNLSLYAGKTKKTIFVIPNDVNVVLTDTTRITITGLCRQAVGDFSSRVRKVRPIEPYKLRGISYLDEIMIKKEGKKRK